MALSKKLIFIVILILLLLVSTLKQTYSTPPYEVDPITFDQNGEVQCSFWSGESIYVRVQVNENNAPVSDKEVYIFFQHAGTGEWVTIGNIGRTDFEGRVYAIIPVNTWFFSPKCGLYRLFAKVWENGEFVQKEGWNSLYIYPSGCPPPPEGGTCGPVAGLGGSPFIFKIRKASEILA